MTKDEVDAFYAARRRALTAVPAWQDGNRLGERRTQLPVEVNGVISTVSLQMTVRLQDPAYLMIALAAGRQFCRLCMTTGHRDRATGHAVKAAHCHSWESNRPKGLKIPRELGAHELVPAEIKDKTEAFTWFLQRNGIDFPGWGPPVWPLRQGLL